MFSNAFSMVEDMIALQQQQRAAFENNTQSHKPRTRDFPRDAGSGTEGEEDGLAYGQHSINRRKSVLSRIKERLLDGKRSPRKEEGAFSSSSREESPAPSPRIGRRENFHRADPPVRERSQQRPRPSPIHIVVEHEDEDSEDSDSDAQPMQSPTLNYVNLEALGNTVEHERRALRACKKKLEHASRQRDVTASLLQQVVDELKNHEHALVYATDCLNKARSEQRKSGMPQPQARSRPQSYHPRHSQQRPPMGPTLDGHFFPAFAGFGFESHSSHGQSGNHGFGSHEQPHVFNQFPRPQSFGDFEHFFGHMPPPMADDAHFHFFDEADAHPQSSRPKRTRYSQGPPPAHRQSHQFPAFTPPPTPPSPQPPSSLLKPAEAQKLFQSYNGRWNALLPTDPAIPYPARGLKASSLSARDSIWAPRTKTGIAMWNEETVMQANAQAFYLGVVGLRPEYVETGHGQIECGFEKSSASPEQIKQLVDILKKEKPRWHSDRLGRRNGGVMGGMPNEMLQKDVRARAVFHAVCELMDRALE